ncbi:hypothetical protein C0J52_24143 [Blattella germanica]|nr:hypothetical protein C0J52_24143 [Blattella germanica]
MGTWNVRTLMRTGALKDILLQITTYKLDIIAIQETRWTGQQIWDTKDFTIFSHFQHNKEKEELLS